MRKLIFIFVFVFLCVTDVSVYSQSISEAVSRSRKFDISENTSEPVIASFEKSDVDINIPVSVTVNEDYYVVIIANENYRRVASVPFALNDGRVFREYCTKTLGIPTQQVHLVENATLSDIRYEVTWLKDIINIKQGKAKAIFYYTGHGAPDDDTKNSYLLPVDGYATDYQTAYSLDDLYAELGSSDAQMITYFIDACFSGATRNDGIEPLIPGKTVGIKAKAGKMQGNSIVFSASTGEQTAYPYYEKKHGMFTYFLLEKLKSTRGMVSYSDLKKYLEEKVGEQSLLIGTAQTPTVSVSQKLDIDLRNIYFK